MSASVERLSLEGPAGALEAVVEDPGAAGPSYAVVCHPHPLYGGTMDNKVVTTVARALQESGIPTLRFNFRGVGASAGAFDRGSGETDDADAVAAWGAGRWPGRRARALRKQARARLAEGAGRVQEACLASFRPAASAARRSKIFSIKGRRVGQT